MAENMDLSPSREQQAANHHSSSIQVYRRNR